MYKELLFVRYWLLLIHWAQRQRRHYIIAAGWKAVLNWFGWNLSHHATQWLANRWSGAGAHWSDPKLFCQKLGFEHLGRDPSSFRQSALLPITWDFGQPSCLLRELAYQLWEKLSFFPASAKLFVPRLYDTLQRKSHLGIPKKGIARPQSQFPHSCVCERFIYSQDQSTYFPAAE